MRTAGTTAHRTVNPWIVAVAVMSSTVMEVLDTTVVNVSLPHVAGNLSATIEEATWVLTSYLVANAIILPLTGWLANYIGRKRLLLIAVTGFTVSSFLCGLAPGLRTLIFFRILQGVFGGSLQPQSQAVLLESFAPQDRGKAMAFWGLGIVVAPILGPVLGGWITDNYTWRWIFYLNVPVGILSVIMIQLYVFDPPYIRRGSARIDYWGIGLLAVGIGALQMMLDKGQQEDWFASDWIRTAAVVAAVGLIAFIIRELLVSDPVVNLRVLKVRTYGAGVFIMTVLGFVLYGSMVMIPVLLQTSFGYPALQAGVAMAPRGLGSFLAMPVVGILTAKFDPRKLLALGITGSALTLFRFSQLSLNAGYWDFFWPQLLQGISLGLVFVPLTTATMAPIPNEMMGNATSIYSLMRNLGASVGIATVTTLLSRQQQSHINWLGAQVTAYNEPARSALGAARSAFWASGSDLPTATSQSHAALFGMVARQASMLSFLEVFRLLAVIFLAVLPLLLLMKRPAKRHETGFAAE